MHCLLFLQPLYQLVVDLRARILQYVGVPVCIGIGPTKMLAKMANKMAKKHSENGVYVIDNDDSARWALKNTEIDEVWGIGPRYGFKLIKDGVYTAYDFVNLPEFNNISSFDFSILTNLPCNNLERLLNRM